MLVELDLRLLLYLSRKFVKSRTTLKPFFWKQASKSGCALFTGKYGCSKLCDYFKAILIVYCITWFGWTYPGYRFERVLPLVPRVGGDNFVMLNTLHRGKTKPLQRHVTTPVY